MDSGIVCGVVDSGSVCWEGFREYLLGYIPAMCVDIDSGLNIWWETLRELVSVGRLPEYVCFD